MKKVRIDKEWIAYWNEGKIYVKKDGSENGHVIGTSDRELTEEEIIRVVENFLSMCGVMED